MQKLGFLLLSFIVVVAVQAQKKIFPSHLGSFTLENYDTNILRVSFQPKNYKKNENISDAVIAKPLMKIISSDITNIGGAMVIPHVPGELFIDYHEMNNHRGFTFSLKADEKIFGGGERALPLNRRGYRLNLYNNPWFGYAEGADNLNYSVPFITSSEGYGLFFDNPSKGYLDIGKESKDILEYGASSGELNVYIIFGDYQTILQSYHKLTGTQPLPPRWALGNLMSRFGYTSEAQVKDIYAKMKAEDIPVDAVIFDLFWFGDSVKNTMGNLDWVNKSKWPYPKKMIADFKKKGVQTILVTEPYFIETSKNYLASKPYLAVDSLNKPYYLTDFYFGKGGLIDIFRKDAQSWFWQFYKTQMLNGVEAWWGDLGEPERHPSNMYHNLKDYGHKRLFAADEVHNLYGHNWTKMLYNFYAKEYPDKRLFSLNRSGFAGTQRYSIFPWTGDVSRSWSGLRAQLLILLGMSMSGVPYVHSDAGGFAGGEGDSELYVRWLQFAAFTPIFRPHGTALYEKDTAAFSFPSEAALIDKEFKMYAKAAVLNRYSFLPYNYTLAYNQAKNREPLMAPLYYHFAADTSVAKIQDQYMWGEDILIVPVVEKGATTRSYYLPQGKWYHVYKDTVLDGRSWYTDNINIGKFPLLYREGSFIVRNGIENTSYYKGDTLSVWHVPSVKPSSYQLYNDDGVSKNSLTQKKYELITFKSDGLKPNNLKLKIASDKGIYAGKPQRRVISLLFGHSFESFKQITVNGKKISKKGSNNYSLENKGLVVEVIFTGNPLDIAISW